MKLFVLGGAKSGKSSLAQARAEEEFRAGGCERLVFLATAQAGDQEMAERIRCHQDQRGDEWTTVEEPLDLAGVLRKAGPGELILLDCLTLWLSNVMAQEGEAGGERVDKRIGELVEAIGACRADLILVANEVGLGLVPVNGLAREYRDYAGRLNQMVGNAVSEVVFVAAGLPLRLK